MRSVASTEPASPRQGATARQGGGHKRMNKCPCGSTEQTRPDERWSSEGTSDTDRRSKGKFIREWQDGGNGRRSGGGSGGSRK